MVVKVPDTFGDMISKGNIIIPCQCYYNARDNILTEVIKHSYSPFLQSSEYIPQINQPNNFENIQKMNRKDAQTETPMEKCCICEYFRTLEMNQNKKKLWNMQFNRWWGWNWQRKRNDFLSKLKMKCNKHSVNDTTKFNNICHHHHIPKQIEVPSISSKDSFVPEKRKIPKNIPEFAEPKHAVPPSTTYGFKKPYVSRRKKYKQKQKLYEGWVKEINSSESDDSVQSIKLKMKCPDSSNIKEKGNYLSFRLRKINSDESLDYDYKAYPKSKLINHSDSKYVSPVSGRLYNITFPELSVPFSETHDSEYLKPINVKDCSVIPRLRYDWVENFSLIKDEHRKLLLKINEVLNSSKTIDQSNKNVCTESQNEYKSFDAAISTSPINKLNKNVSCNLINNSPNIPNFSSHKIENYGLELQKPPIFFDHKSDTVCTSTNPFYNSLFECSKSVNLPYVPNFGQENLSKEVKENENVSLNTYFDCSTLNNQQNSRQKSLGEVEYMDVDNTQESIYLNNLFSMPNSKSNLNLKEDNEQKLLTNIKEDMSERILEEIDYMKNLTLLYNN